MIQIGKLRTWTPQDSDEEKIYFKVIPNFCYRSLKDCFDNIEQDLPKFIPNEKERYNIFYTVAHHLEGKRYKSSWQAQDIIPIDLDGIDLDRIDEYPPLVAKALDIDLNKCAVVYSGNGCHVLIQVERITDKEYLKENKAGYLKLLENIEKECQDAGLPFTKDSTAWDYARILRLPSTFNIKKDKEGKDIVKEARLIQNNLTEQNLKIEVVEKVNKKLAMPKGSFPLPDDKTILRECEFFKWLDASPEEVHEPHAYAMLSISGHFTDDQATTKRLWEKFDSPSINAKNLEEFTEQALRASGPRTCEGIAEIFEGCKNCTHYKKITSPILIKGDDFIGTAHCGFTLKGPRGGLIRQYDDLLKAYDNQYKHRSVGPIKKIYVWTGSHYKIADQIEIKNFAYTKFIPLSKSDERREFLSLVTDSNYSGKEFLSGEDCKGYINFKNGVFNIKTGELLPHDSSKPFLYCLPYEYNPDAKAEYFEGFLHEITLGREDLKNILLEYLGYIVSGEDYIFQKALILEGSGKNGKSTFINLIRMLVGGENCSNISIQKLEQNTFASSGLHGKLVNFSEEEPPKTFSDTNGTFKNLTGDGVVNAEYKYGDAFEFINRAKLIISYNEKPYIKDTSEGMLRRLLIVPFDYDLNKYPEKVNPHIKDDLEKELSGIFNLALEGYKRLLKNKAFTKSKAVEEMVGAIHKNSDIVKAFLDDCVERTPDEEDYITYSDMYNNFVRYFEDQNEGGKVISKKGFSLRMKKYNFNTVQRKIHGKNFKVIPRVSIDLGEISYSNSKF